MPTLPRDLIAPSVPCAKGWRPALNIRAGTEASNSVDRLLISICGPPLTTRWRRGHLMRCLPRRTFRSHADGSRTGPRLAQHLIPHSKRTGSAASSRVLRQAVPAHSFDPGPHVPDFRVKSEDARVGSCTDDFEAR